MHDSARNISASSCAVRPVPYPKFELGAFGIYIRVNNPDVRIGKVRMEVCVTTICLAGQMGPRRNF